MPLTHQLQPDSPLKTISVLGLPMKPQGYPGGKPQKLLVSHGWSIQVVEQSLCTWEATPDGPSGAKFNPTRAAATRGGCWLEDVGKHEPWISCRLVASDSRTYISDEFVWIAMTRNVVQLLYICIGRTTWYSTNNKYWTSLPDTLVERGATDTAPIRLLEEKTAACEGAVCLLRMTQHESVPHWSLVLPFASPCWTARGCQCHRVCKTFWLRLSVLLTDASLGPKRLGSEVLFTTAKWCQQLHLPKYGRTLLWSLSIYYSHHLKVSALLCGSLIHH